MRAAGSFCWRSAFSAAPTRRYRALGRAGRAGRGLSSSPSASLFLLLHGTDLSSSPRGCKRRGKYLFCLGGNSQGDRSVSLKDLNSATCCFLLIPSQMLMSGGPSSSRQAQVDCGDPSSLAWSCYRLPLKDSQPCTSLVLGLPRTCEETLGHTVAT